MQEAIIGSNRDRIEQMNFNGAICCARDNVCQRCLQQAEMKCAQEVKVSLLYQEK